MGGQHGRDAFDSGRGPRPMAFDNRLHGVFRRVDDLRHHRRKNPTGSRAERDRIRPPHRHPHSNRVALPGFPRHLARPVWRPRRLRADHAVGCRRDLPPLLRHNLSVDARRRTRRRAGRRVLRRRPRLCVQVVPPGGTRAAALAVMAIVFWFTTDDDPELKARRARKEKPRSMLLQLAPLRHPQVWRFSLYYFFVFGGFVALALWLPRYLIGVYGLNIETAGMLAAAYSIPASLFRAYGGALSHRYCARAGTSSAFFVLLV